MYVKEEPRSLRTDVVHLTCFGRVHNIIQPKTSIAVIVPTYTV
jgi:hypothetical protein